MVLVAVCSESPFYASYKLSKEFRAFVEENGDSEVLPEGSFKEAGTMVKTRLVRLIK